jgi:cobalt-zinc-cadmium efflux system outer membrane protein
MLDYGSRRNRIRQAEASAKAEELRLAGSEQQVRQEVIQAVARLKAADAVIKSFEGGVLDQAQRLLESTRRGFQLGETSLVAVLEVQRTYRNVRAEYIEALASHAEAQAQLELATGSVPASVLQELRRSEANNQ